MMMIRKTHFQISTPLVANWRREALKSEDSSDLRGLNGRTIAEACIISVPIHRFGGVQNGIRFEQIYFYF